MRVVKGWREVAFLDLAVKSYHQPRKAVDRLYDLVLYAPRRLVGFSLIYLIYAVQRLWRRDYIVVSPAVPRRLYSFWKLGMLAGIRLVPEGTELGPKFGAPLARMRHFDRTWDGGALPGYVNGRCTDISKSHVDRIFQQVFGYSTKIDPTRFQGQAVIKSEENFAGGGAFVECPILQGEVQPGMIYQVLVDNQVARDRVEEYRASIIGGRITDVMIKYRDVARRLKGRGSGGSKGSSLHSAEQVFTVRQIRQIEEFCKRIGIDFGELDVLPDIDEARLYILDANKTPSVMVHGNSFRAARFRLLMQRARAFSAHFRSRTAGSRSDIRDEIAVEGLAGRTGF